MKIGAEARGSIMNRRETKSHWGTKRTDCKGVGRGVTVGRNRWGRKPGREGACGDSGVGGTRGRPTVNPFRTFFVSRVGDRHAQWGGDECEVRPKVGEVDADVW